MPPLRRFIRRKDHAPDLLAAVCYILLAMGDTNYTRSPPPLPPPPSHPPTLVLLHSLTSRPCSFCNAGRSMDKRLLDLGARPLLPRWPKPHNIKSQNL